MLKASYIRKVLKFINPATTSRGALTEKVSYFVFLYEDSNSLIKGIGEASPIPGLSGDYRPGFEKKLSDVCNLISRSLYKIHVPLYNYPSIQFALESADADLMNGGQRILFPSEFTEGKDFIKINGLIWIDSIDSMLKQIRQKLELGFRCLKLKVGTHDFQEEIDLIRHIRNQFQPADLEIRLDANGAFHPKEALQKMGKLAKYQIHSIEQPILHAQLDEMATLCKYSPIPIALDEELIGKYPFENKKLLLKLLNPKYIVLKPMLLGGFSACKEWIKIADDLNIEWWITSALESNIGLNALAQWTYSLDINMPQGLGTGLLYQNNIPSPLYLDGEKLCYNPKTKWDIKTLKTS